MRLAIFDFDGTVLRGNSWHAFYWWAVKRAPWRAPELLGALAARRARSIAAPRLRDLALRRLHGLDAAAVAAIGETIYASRLRRRVRSAARREISAARAHDMVPVLATAAFDFLVAPAAAELGIADVIATKVAFANGVCLGRSVPPEPRGAAKVAALRQHFAATEVDWERSAAFSDELEDLPLLTCTGAATFVGRGAVRGGLLPATVRVADWDADR